MRDGRGESNCRFSFGARYSFLSSSSSCARLISRHCLKRSSPTTKTKKILKTKAKIIIYIFSNQLGEKMSVHNCVLFTNHVAGFLLLESRVIYSDDGSSLLASCQAILSPGRTCSEESPSELPTESAASKPKALVFLVVFLFLYRCRYSPVPFIWHQNKLKSEPTKKDSLFRSATSKVYF